MQKLKAFLILSLLYTSSAFSDFPSLLGEGISSIGGIHYSDKKLNCVIPIQSEVIAELGGGQLEISAKTYNSVNEFEKEISTKIKSDRGFNLGFFEPGVKRELPLASLSGKIEKSTEKLSKYTQKTSITIIDISISKIFHEKSLLEYRFNPTILAYLKKHPSQFYEKCGDTFVSGVQPGILVNARLFCELNSSQHLESDLSNLKRGIDANFNNPEFSFGGGAHSSKDLTSFFKVYESELKKYCTLDFNSLGGRGSISNDIETFASSAISFVSTSTISDAYALGISTASYLDAILDEEVQEIANQLDYEFISHAKQQVGAIQDNIELSYLKIIQIENDNDLEDSEKEARIADFKKSIYQDERKILSLSRLKRVSSIPSTLIDRFSKGMCSNQEKKGN